jgi:hypothetical protein
MIVIRPTKKLDHNAVKRRERSMTVVFISITKFAAGIMLINTQNIAHRSENP